MRRRKRDCGRLANVLSRPKTVHEAKTHFSKLIRQALAGDNVIVSRGRQPVVRIVPLEEAKRDRVPGGAKGLVKDISADFDCPIEEFEQFMR